MPSLVNPDSDRSTNGSKPVLSFDSMYVNVPPGFTACAVGADVEAGEVTFTNAAVVTFVFALAVVAVALCELLGPLVVEVWEAWTEPVDAVVRAPASVV